jgi:hypothetical protein
MELIVSWANENVGGVNDEQCYGLHIPKNIAKLYDFYDFQFERFHKLVDIGSKKYTTKVSNSASNKEELIYHANIFEPLFESLVTEAVEGMEQCIISSGEENIYLQKKDDGIDFKLSFTSSNLVNDMLRTTIVCSSINSIESSVKYFCQFCDEKKLQYKLTNFYESVPKYRELDRSENNFTGYVGIHVNIELKIPKSTIANLVPNNNIDNILKEKDNNPQKNIESSNNNNKDSFNDEFLVLMAEVQFHPVSFFNGQKNSIKLLQSKAYRSVHNDEAKKDGLEIKAKSAMLLYMTYAMSLTVD